MSLTVSGTAGNLFWRSGTWDNGISTSWYNANTASSDKFFAGDNTTFDDSAGTGNGTVTINGAVQPAGLIVSNTAVSYIFSGTGSIVGATSLVMNGPGSLTIGTSNSYSGGTNLNAGLLALNNSGAIGLGTLTIIGGTLDSTVAGITLPNNAQNWNGDFAFNGTQSLNMGTGAVTLGSNRTVNVNASTLTVGGAISGNGYSLTKAGQGQLTLSGNISYTGTTTVNGGTLQTQGNANFSNSSLILVNSGATIAVATGNGLVGGAVPGTYTTMTQINAGGTIINTLTNGNGAATVNLFPLVLNGGTLSATVSDTVWGSWDPLDGISTLGNGSTSYIAGGNMALYNGGGPNKGVFNVGAGDRLIVSNDHRQGGKHHRRNPDQKRRRTAAAHRLECVHQRHHDQCRHTPVGQRRGRTGRLDQ